MISDKILYEIKTNLKVNKAIGEKTILFTSIILTKKKSELIPTYTTIIDQEVKKKIDNLDINWSRYNTALRELSDAIAEIMDKGGDVYD